MNIVARVDFGQAATLFHSLRDEGVAEEKQRTGRDALMG